MLRIRSRRPDWLATPTVQVVVAGAVMVGGAWLIAAWMVGVVLMLVGLMLGVDALLRDTATSAPTVTHETVLERYRRAG